jgi:hypothetical protein
MKTSKFLIILFFVAAFSFVFGAYAHREKYIARTRLFVMDQITGPEPSPTIEPTIIPTIRPPVENLFPSLNELPLEPNQDSLSFLVAGHIYGSHNQTEFHPAMTLQTNLQLINQMDLDMVVLLGDIVPATTEGQFQNLKRYFLDYLTMPVFNAVGNHDIESREIYENRYGETVFSFKYKNNLFLFMDTTIEPCSLPAVQIDRIVAEIEALSPGNPLEGIHIFLHHVIFLDEERLSNQQPSMPNQTCPPAVEFNTLLQDTLIPTSAVTPIYLYAGDVGAWSNNNLSPYYELIPNSNVTRVATGLAYSDGDSVLIVREIDGQLSIEPLSLTGKPMLPIETYNYQYWVSQSE